MSDVVGTSTVTLGRGEDRPRGVSVAAGGVTAGRASESPDTQPEAFLGSRTALGAGHRGVGGRHQHHLPARPRTPLDQFRLHAPIAASAALRAIRDLARNFGLKSSTAIRWWLSTTRLAHCRASWVFCRAAFLCDPGGLPLRAQVALRRGLALGPATTGHLALALARSAAHRLRWPRCGRSKAGSVVVAVVLTPQSTPMAGRFASGLPAAASRRTTNDAYQWPRLSW